MVAKSVSHTKATATWCQKAAAAGPKSKARRPSGAAQDDALAERLWALSVEATGVGGA